MQGDHGSLESENASVIKVAREPVIIINGVPSLTSDCAPNAQAEVKCSAKSQVDPHFGEWLEGRKVRKLFGDKYYSGKVVKYDSESNWYTVVYEDGDQEDLEWHELEEVLMPLDITIPLKMLVMEKFKLQKTVPDSRPKVGRPRKVYAMIEGGTDKISHVVPVSVATDVMSDQILMIGMGDDQESMKKVGSPTKHYAKGERDMKNAPELLPVSTSNGVMSNQLPMLDMGENAGACLKYSNQPRKRGRPRKDTTISGDQPRKRGRPRKDRTISSNPQSAEGTPSSLALVPISVSTIVQDASVGTDIIAQDASRRQNDVLRRNMQTARAEKLKRRENLHVQGTSPGTQLL